MAFLRVAPSNPDEEEVESDQWEVARTFYIGFTMVGKVNIDKDFDRLKT